MRPRVVSHLNATDSIGHGPGVYFLQEKSRNLSAVTTNQPAMVEMTQPPKSA